MDREKPVVYEFGEFLLDRDRRRLLGRSSDEPLAITAKTFDLLLYLVEHRGETVDKDELLRAIWPGLVVEENSLTQAISLLRQVLQETPGENRYIATVPRRGYRFVATVRELTTAAAAEIVAPPVESPTIKAKPSRSAVWILALALATLLACGLYFWHREAATKPSGLHTLAILPFKPLLLAERDESLELGMTESMIESLGDRSDLIVNPLSSVRHYGGIEQDPLAAGRALHAESVLEGSVQRRADQLRVSVRLLNVGDGRQQWAKQFDEKISDVFAVQEAISAAVAEALALESTPTRSVNSQSLGGTKDSAAYLLYAHGRFALARSTAPSLDLAIGYFEQAIERDASFARAYSGLADCYMVMGIFGMRSPAESFPRGRDAALKALKLEPRLGSAYATLGHIKMQYDRDWDGAAADLAQAIKLDPALSEPHLYWGVLLGMRGELQRGLEEIQRAQQLEPLLTLPKTRAGSLLYFAHRYNEAIVQLNESVRLDDRPGIVHAALGRAYMHTGQYELASAEFEQIHGPTPGSFGDVGQLLALSGRRAEALAELHRVLTLSKHQYISAVDIASIYAALGDTDNALVWLDRALQQRASTLGFLAQNPAFDALHSDARFSALVDRVGILNRPVAK